MAWSDCHEYKDLPFVKLNIHWVFFLLFLPQAAYGIEALIFDFTDSWYTNS